MLSFVRIRSLQTRRALIPKYELRVVAKGTIGKKKEFEAQDTEQAVSMLPTLLGDVFIPTSSEEAVDDLVFRLYRVTQSFGDADEIVFACFVKINHDHEIKNEQEVIEYANLLTLLGYTPDRLPV